MHAFSFCFGLPTLSKFCRMGLSASYGTTWRPIGESGTSSNPNSAQVVTGRSILLNAFLTTCSFCKILHFQLYRDAARWLRTAQLDGFGEAGTLLKVHLYADEMVCEQDETGTREAIKFWLEVCKFTCFTRINCAFLVLSHLDNDMWK